jgi:hypothetical protein
MRRLDDAGMCLPRDMPFIRPGKAVSDCTATCDCPLVVKHLTLQGQALLCSAVLVLSYLEGFLFKLSAQKLLPQVIYLTSTACSLRADQIYLTVPSGGWSLLHHKTYPTMLPLYPSLRPPCRHLVTGLHCNRDAHGQASLAGLRQPGVYHVCHCKWQGGPASA